MNEEIRDCMRAQHHILRNRPPRRKGKEVAKISADDQKATYTGNAADPKVCGQQQGNREADLEMSHSTAKRKEGKKKGGRGEYHLTPKRTEKETNRKSVKKKYIAHPVSPAEPKGKKKQHPVGLPEQ